MNDRNSRHEHTDSELRLWGLGLALALIAYEIFVLAGG